MTKSAQRHRSSTKQAQPPCRSYFHLYNNSRWREASKRFLAQPANRFCWMCKQEGKLVLSRCTDHHEPHRGDESKFWDVSNWRGLCLHHHSVKTKQEQQDQ